MFDHGNESNMGHQNEAHVTIKLKDSHQSLKAPMALQKYLGRSPSHVQE